MKYDQWLVKIVVKCKLGSFSLFTIRLLYFARWIRCGEVADLTSEVVDLMCEVADLMCEVADLRSA